MYRKRINSILIVCTLMIFGMTGGLNAQNKPTSSTENSGSFSEVSLKKSKIPESQLARGEDIVWKRDVYRMIDLKKSQNGILYYPVEPIGDRMNLFSLIFDLVANNKISSYEYLDGREIFTDAYAIKFKDLLKRFEIPYREKNDPKKANASIFEIDAVDIPSTEVTLYYIKELWYLDQRNSTVNAKPVALCPILVRDDEMGETRTYPMFWISFESLKPYLSQIPVSADSLNSATRLSAYDYFNQRRYEGDIYKVSNLKNQTIMQYCKTPETIKAEQERLEKEFLNIDTSLWEKSQRQLQKEADRKKIKKSDKTSGKK
ncbi:MAG: gliding motility protein GldN [Bacteroidales bacterium]|nr:gliding motility protein GldN [Bacteroidales bacterium]